MYRYVLLEKCRITVQVGTYRYVLVQENVKKYVRVRTQLRTERPTVQGSTERYRAVHEIMVQGSTGQSTTRYKAVHGGTCQYTVCGICAGPRAGGPGGAADFGARLFKSLPTRSQSLSKMLC